MTETQIFTLAIVLLTVLDLLTVVVRLGLLNASLPRLLAQRERTPERVDRTIRLLQSLPRTQASLNMARLLWRFLIAGLLVWYIMQQPVGQVWWQALLVILLAAFVLFWAEWALSQLVLKSPETWAMSMTLVARIIIFLVSPLTIIPLLLSGDITRTSESSSQPYVTEDDLKIMVDTGQQEGLLELGERRMIHRIFDLGETLAREIMVPRIDVMALDVQTPLDEALDALLHSGYSRVPVFEETVDNVLGLLYAKDLLRVWREGGSLQDLKNLLRPAYFVPEAKKVDELLAEMQSQRIHMAIVVDEYGGVAGLVTLEDIVEEIVGEIVDEFDLAEESPYETLDEGEFMFLGRIDLDDFNEIVASSLPKDEADSLGGYIYSRLGHVPSPGETVEIENLRLTVEQVSGRRIRKVRVQWLPAAAQNQENGKHVDDE